jgi:peptide/nickel transport system permease protein
MNRRLSLAARIGLAIILANLVAALAGPWLAPYGETDIVADVWQGPSAAHWLGTDNLGRDMLSRLLYGAQNTVLLALLITAISFTVGGLLGLLAAVWGGWVDQALGRGIDVVMAFPTLILSLVVLTITGSSIPALVGVVALLDSTRVFRLTRAVARDIAVTDYVEAARLRGERLWWVMRAEILPNALPPLIAEFGLRFCFASLFISSLSFLGLGLQPPQADWGGMVRDNANAISFGLLVPLFPALALALLTVGVNLVVDWLLRRSQPR